MDRSKRRGIISQPLVLIVSGSNELLARAGAHFPLEDFRVSLADNREEAVERISLVDPDLLVIDSGMEPPAGYEQLMEAWNRHGMEETPVLWIGDEDPPGQTLACPGMSDHISRQRLDRDLRNRASSLIEAAALRKEVQRLEEELKQARQLLDIMGVSDSSTGLYNRTGFVTLVNHHMKVARRSGQPMLLVNIDIDGLAETRERQGDIAAEQLLWDTAVIIRQSFRESDIMAYLGEAGFAVFLLDSGEVHAGLVLARLEQHLALYNRSDSRVCDLTIRTRVASCEASDDMLVEDLLNNNEAFRSGNNG